MRALDWRVDGESRLVIDAPPREVYDAVADVTRIGERSPECRTAVWLDGRQGAVGSRFRGSNRSGPLARWSRTCEVIEAEPGVAFAFRTVPSRDPSRRDSTVWSYRLEPSGRGTQVVHSYRVVMLPLLPFRFVYGLALPDHRDMRPQMRQNLEALKRQLERS